ncbi:MAG: SRPBCC domain-containing protein [Calditrichaeota bacterium]|nr:SRPBCC domain-containing protein [Calditrichota bacterium]MCB9367047.1 SRPBCC domain-containing protein [Calditrichota bacterium]MCB9391469.1 SRPBCC domain-containing protein [Calditrichota bacterium]
MFRTLLALLLCAVAVQAELTANDDGSFTVIETVTLPGEPDVLYDAMTGDISGWWDHSFSDQPHALKLEAWPGGRFIEEFDDQGNGALHATVILADRGKMIRYEGPMGLSGRALTNVVTYEFSAEGDSTTIKVTAQVIGQVNTELADIVNKVWYHFVHEAFAPYVLAGKHK